MNITAKSVLKGLKEYALITLGILMFVLGWSIFLVPNNLVGGGVTGVASIIQYATRGAIKIGYTYFFVNAVLLVIALFTLGKNFGGKTVYATIIASIGLNLFQQIIPAEICQTLAIDNGKLMSTIMGGILVGVGIGLTMSNGGSTGGTDIIALIVNKYRGVSPGRMILWMDAGIILSSFFVPSYTADGELMLWTEKVTTVVYGFLLVVTTSTVLDMYIQGSRQSVQVMVLSKHYDKIADAITQNLRRGVTVLHGEGWYTKQESQVLMIITRKSDLNLLLRYIKQIDPDVFMSVTSVTGVYGKGFESIKVKANPKKKEAEPVQAPATDEGRALGAYAKLDSMMNVKAPYLNAGLDVAGLAKMADIDPELLSEAIKAGAKTNFRGYINSYRIHYAARVIKDDPRIKFSEVARMAGFGSLPPFNAYFRLHIGKTPSEYLAEILKDKQ